MMSRPRLEIIGKAGEIPVGKMKRYICPFADVLVANVEGVYYAVSNTCSHAGELLSNGMLIGSQVICAAHYAVFNLANGEVIRHPEGATIAPLKTFKVKVENSEILIELDNES